MIVGTTSRRRRRAATGVVLVLVFMVAGLAGCGHSKRAAPRPAPEPEASPSTTAPPPPPVAGRPASCPTPPASIGNQAVTNIGQLSFVDLTSRALSQSTADPDGTNADTDHPDATLANGSRVLFSATGPGVLTTLRSQHADGGPYKLDDDGTTTPVDLHTFGRPLGKLAPAAYPLTVGVSQTSGSSVLQDGIGFTKQLTWTSSQRVGYSYSLYDRLPEGTPVPRPAPSGSTDPVAAMLRAGARSQLPSDLTTYAGRGVQVTPGSGTVLTTLHTGAGGTASQIRELSFTVPLDQLSALGGTRLQIWWDGATAPAVDAPLRFVAGDGAGVDAGAPGTPVISTYLTSIGTTATTATYDLYWPMPFRTSARIALVAPPRPLSGLSWTAGTQPFAFPSCWWAPFHATDTPVPTPVRGQDMTFLDTTGTGRIVGTVVNFHDTPGQPMDWSDPQANHALEGDVHITSDGAGGPQINSTGTEEWAFGGSYWNLGHPADTPLAGMLSPLTPTPGGDLDGAAEYRWLVPDAIPFTSSAKVTWEHGGVDDVEDPYQATVLWYGNPTPDGTLSDTLLPGGPASAAAHHFAGSVSTSTVTSGWWYTVRSVAATLPDTSGTATTSFTMAVTPGSIGAYLRRTLDTAFADQRAEVYVDGTDVGTWYEPGGSNGRDRTGERRVWIDDELPLPASVIAGHSTIQVTVVPASGSTWTAARYQLQSVAALAQGRAPA